ncbi:hypothetical protein WMY93_009874 [Mugilogobius chulae]|uniref:Ig-like domain-containing protein n=1 Tax=Mugilogobius chulae TaxID=88201 RepID=A0AAW0P674_9GOBI
MRVHVVCVGLVLDHAGPVHDDDHIQIGREVKITCQVEATPPEELAFDWLKNGRPLRSSERMVITPLGGGAGGGAGPGGGARGRGSPDAPASTSST